MSLVSVLNKLGSWKLFLVLFGAYLFFNYRIYEYKTRVLDPMMGGEQVLDLRFGFSRDDVKQFFDRGVELQAAFERVYTDGYDILMPLFLNLSAISLYAIFFPGSKIVLIPVFCFFFDMLENYTLYRMLAKYKQDHLEENAENNGLAMMASTDNLIKWFFAGVGLVLLIVGAARYIFNGCKRPVSHKKTK